MGRTVLPFTQELYREEESWKPFRRAMGFLNGNETPDFTRYEEMLREAEEELLGLVQGHVAIVRP